MTQLILDPSVIAGYAGLIFDMDGTLIDTMPATKKRGYKPASILAIR